MALSRFIAVVVLVILIAACSRNTASTSGNSGYTYNEPKSTDPNAYDAKPKEPVAPPVAQDTTWELVESPPVPTDGPQPAVPGDEFAKHEPWMTPTPGTYLAVKIKKTPCYGTCPSYTAAIYSDGRAFFHGERFVEQIGYYQGKITIAQVAGLIKLGYQNNFFNLAKEYPLDGNYIVDLPTTVLHLNSSKDNKTIVDRGNSPTELDVLEEATHNLLQSIQWLPIKQ